MTALLKAEYLKNRRRYIFLTALALTAAAGATLAATGLFLGLRSRKRNEQL